MRTNTSFKLERRIRARIYTAFKTKGLDKTQRTWKYIGCSPTMLQTWLEYQYYDGMTTENYGSVWHIDHVKPCNFLI
jgi:hypothetical protein